MVGMSGGLEEDVYKRERSPSNPAKVRREGGYVLSFLFTLLAGRAFPLPARLYSLSLFPGLEILSAPSSSFSMFAVCVFVFLG